MSDTRLTGAADVMATIEGASLSVIELGRTPFDDPVFAARRGPSGGPELMITAGAHAGEPSGVYAAVDILTTWDDSLPLTVVPLRDPFAFEGMARCLQRVTGVLPTLEDHSALREFLLTHATQTFSSTSEFVFVDLGVALAASLPPSNPPAGPRLIEARLNALLADDPALVAALAGRRVFYPSNAGPVAEDVGDFGRAFSAEFSEDGVVRDMNRRFGQPDAPPEVRLVSEFAESVQPYVSLDLHEGQGSTFYLFVSAYGTDERTTRYADAIMDRLLDMGLQPTTLADVVDRLGEGVRESYTEGRPGILVDRPNDSPHHQFSSFAARFGPSITVESGRWAPLAQRIAVHRNAVEATAQAIRTESARPRR